MAKNDDAKNSQETAQNWLDKLKFELAKLGLKIVEDTGEFKIEIADSKKFQAKIQEDPAKIWIDQLRIELAKLGLKIIEDINDRRVSKPEETYNSLVSLYNAVKN